MSPVSDSDHRRIEAVVFPDNCVVESHQISDPARGLRRVPLTKVWRTERLLGRGGFGEVHLQSLDSDKDVKRALKIILAKGASLSTADCQAELTAMIEFTKPKYRDAAVFVDFIGWFQKNDAMFLAMEYMPLGDLERNLREIEMSPIHTPLSEVEVQEITRQILEGLKIMHAEGFAHRDLKPQNVFVVQKHPQWWVKLGDFGLSKKRTAGTAYRTHAGTQEYMAPELFYLVEGLCTETSEYTNAIDLWSVGCIIHRMVTGKVPFPCLRTLKNYCVDQTKVPLNIPPTMEEARKFVQGLLMPYPETRPAACTALESIWLTTETEPTRLRNDKETSLARSNVSESQSNYNTASHKGLQSSPMPILNDILLDYAKREPASELPEFTRIINEVKLDQERQESYSAPSRLHAVVEAKDVAVLRELLKHGLVDINEKSPRGETALHIAVRQDDPLLVEILLDNKADITIGNSNGDTAMVLARQSDRILRIFVEKRPAQINMFGDRSQHTILHWLAVQGNTYMVDFLLSKGADPRIQDIYGETPVHYAAENGCLSVVESLVASRSDLTLLDKGGRTPLRCAELNHHYAVVKFLSSKTEVVPDRLGRSELHFAALNGHYMLVNTYISKGMSVLAQDRNGATPLHLAAAKGHVIIVKTLIAAGADKETRDGGNKTPLDYARLYQQLEVVRYLGREGLNQA